MKLGYTILYVSDVPRSVVFCENTFEQERGFVCDKSRIVEICTPVSPS